MDANIDEMSLVHDEIQSTSFYRGDEEVESTTDSDATCLPSDSPHLDSQRLSFYESCSQNASAGKISQRNTPTQSYHLANQRDPLTRHSTTVEEEIEPEREIEVLDRMKKELNGIKLKFKNGEKTDDKNLLTKINKIIADAQDELILLTGLKASQNSQVDPSPKTNRFAVRKSKFKSVQQIAISLKNRIESKQSHKSKNNLKYKYNQSQSSQQQQNSPSLLQPSINTSLKIPSPLSTNQLNIRANMIRDQRSTSILNLLYPGQVSNNLSRLTQMQQTRIRFISNQELVPTFAGNLVTGDFSASLSSSGGFNRINQW